MLPTYLPIKQLPNLTLFTTSQRGPGVAQEIN